MASSIPLSATTLPSSAPPHKNMPSLFPKTSSLAIHRSRSKFVVSCKASESNNEIQDPNAPSAEITRSNYSSMVDRRNMLIGIGGLYGAAATTMVGGVPASLATPIEPDVSKCDLTGSADPGDNSPGSMGLKCCLNLGNLPIREFEFKDYERQVKTRPAGHQVTKEYVEDFKAAIAEMKALCDDDPRSLHMQSLIHCAYCDGVYRHVGFGDKRYEVHNSWLFYPFHRWYLYFFERIAGSLIGKPDFRIPFWAWDVKEAMRVPEMYLERRSPLYMCREDRINGVVDLRFLGRGNTQLTEEQLKGDNIKVMKEQMLDQKAEALFMGGKYIAGNDTDPGKAGSIERGAHTNIHVWIGKKVAKFSTAGQDPLFYALHGNVDRMWNVWDTKIRGQGDSSYLKDNDYMDASFVFYDEHKRAVRVRVKDCLDERKLGYDYPALPLEWLNCNDNPGRGRGGGRGGGRGHGGGRGGGRGHQGPPGGRGPHGGRGGRGGFRGGRGFRPVSLTTTDASTVAAFPLNLDSVVYTEVERPLKLRNDNDKEEKEEVIVIDMEITHTNNSAIVFDVYINDEYEHDPRESTVATAEYAGSFSTIHVGHHSANGKNKSTFKLGLNQLLKDLGAEDDDTLAVTLVPRLGKDAIVINGVKIDYLGD